MDYYEKFSNGANDKVKALVAQRDELIETIAAAKKNLFKEREAVQNLNGRIAKLKTLSTDSLTDASAELSFAKFKTSKKKLNDELENSEDICATLKDEIIPAKSAELQAVRRAISDKLNAFLLACRPSADEQVRNLIDLAVRERELFAAAFRKIYEDAGAGASSLVMPPSHKQFHKAYTAFSCAKKIQLPKREPDKAPEPTPEPAAEQPARTVLTGETERAEKTWPPEKKPAAPQLQETAGV